MIKKTEFIGLRVTPDQRLKLLQFAELVGEPGNMSAGLRWLVDNAPESTITTTSPLSQTIETAVIHG